MAKYRVPRVRQEILREVNNILMLEIKDPRVEGVTITDVDLTGDLQQATIYYSTLSDLAGQRQKTQAGLDASTGKIRSLLGKKLSIYTTPEIKFERDPSVDYGNRIENILKQINTEEDSETDEVEE
ncbi:30S ribosome-binding factor RbfA [Aerococcaceae bacterium DSM 111176]|nr:30S ribosome-binding factor RbfA [Aerococcaceae bacterium DSM 111176]